MYNPHPFLSLDLTAAYPQVDKHHERHCKYLKQIDPGFTSNITHFLVLDTPRLMNVHSYTQISK